MTSLAFMLVDVPEPVWKMSIGKWSSHSPRSTSAAACSMSRAFSPRSNPNSPLTEALAPLIIPARAETDGKSAIR